MRILRTPGLSAPLINDWITNILHIFHLSSPHHPLATSLLLECICRKIQQATKPKTAQPPLPPPSMVTFSAQAFPVLSFQPSSNVTFAPWTMSSLQPLVSLEKCTKRSPEPSSFSMKTATFKNTHSSTLRCQVDKQCRGRRPGRFISY